MGSISSYANLLAAIAAPYQQITNSLVSATAVSGRCSCVGFKNGLTVGTTPSTAAACTAATGGSLREPTLLNGGTANQQVVTQIHAPTCQPGVWWMTDRLSHQGGLSGTVTTAQTTNLPTAALTRYTSGVGVFARLEIYTAVGVTGTTVTASYTNSGSTSGRTTEAVDFGATGFREAQRGIILPLQAGDVGVKSVESVTVLATTGTAGNFGVTLFKPLFPIIVPQLASSHTVIDQLLNNLGQFPKIQDSACLDLVFYPSSSTSGPSCFSFLISETP